MPTNTFGETSGTPDTFKLHDTDAILPLSLHGFPHTMSVLQINRSAISPHASLRKAGDLVCEGLGLGPRGANRHYLLTGPDPQAFFRWYLAASKNNFHRPTLSHQAREAHCSTIKQWNSPAAAIDAKVRGLFHDANVAPKRELHPASDGRSCNGRNNWLVEFQTRRTKWTTRWGPAIFRKIEIVKRPVATLQRGPVFQIPTCAKCTSFSEQHANARLRVRIEREKGFH